MSLTLDEANRIIRGALAKAQELNIRISAAVCDSGGRLIALQRMDNAIWASAYGSQGKAVASAAFGRPSGEMAERGKLTRELHHHLGEVEVPEPPGEQAGHRPRAGEEGTDLLVPVEDGIGETDGTDWAASNARV